MSIAARLWLGMAVVIALVMTVHVWLPIQKERSLLVDATLRDRRFFGTAMQSVLEHDPADDPWRAARALLTDRAVRAGHIDVALHSRGAITGTARRMPAGERARLARGDVGVAFVGGRL